MVGLGVDGVVVLDEPPLVPFRSWTVSAAGKWRRQIAVPEHAAAVVRTFAEHAQVVWVSAWSYLAHEALREALDLPEEPWEHLAVQFDPVSAVAEYASGRQWMVVTDMLALHRDAPVLAGSVYALDPRRGLGERTVEEWSLAIAEAST